MIIRANVYLKYKIVKYAKKKYVYILYTE